MDWEDVLDVDFTQTTERLEKRAIEKVNKNQYTDVYVICTCMLYNVHSTEEESWSTSGEKGSQG